MPYDFAWRRTRMVDASGKNYENKQHRKVASLAILAHLFCFLPTGHVVIGLENVGGLRSSLGWVLSLEV